MPRILEQGRSRVLELLDDDVEIVMSVRQWAQVANLGYSTLGSASDFNSLSGR